MIVPPIEGIKVVIYALYRRHKNSDLCLVWKTQIAKNMYSIDFIIEKGREIYCFSMSF